MVEDLVDPRRSEPPYVLEGERTMLDAWLEFHRTTLLMKCEGLDDASRKARPIPTSLLSLHGLVRHMAEVERNWFRRVLLHDGCGWIWFDPAIDDSELVPLDDADWEADVAVWRAQRGLSQRLLADRAKLSVSYLCEIETGAKPGSVAALAKLARALDISIDDLV